ncbi:fasciclin domain-containing protein [Brevundimonas sp.]|uniref:fasciclin domain-containing protein n=1 Tax=Brevundimonas sp. TaxID=1871086 RepID=UPI0025DC5F90|nr:fasciclin domain-containing protein [Brevundimonas sp.]
MKTIFGLVAASALVLAACNSSADEAATTAEASAESTAAASAAATPAASGTIVEVAQGNGDFSTLVSAVQAAGLVETLNGAGPFTIFAPTNAAFEKIPAETLQGLLTPEQRDTLTAVLTYHVVSGRVDAATLIEQIQAGGGSATVTTVQGGELTARVVEGGVVLADAAGNQSRVVQTDVAASNGVIHAIDTVVLPG